MRDPSYVAPNAPDFWPVLTLDGRTIDRMVVPFLERLGVAGVMMSMHYARAMDRGALPRLPVFIDSGGFALLVRQGGSSAAGRPGI